MKKKKNNNANEIEIKVIEKERKTGNNKGEECDCAPTAALFITLRPFYCFSLEVGPLPAPLLLAPPLLCFFFLLFAMPLIRLHDDVFAIRTLSKHLWLHQIPFRTVFILDIAVFQSDLFWFLPFTLSISVGPCFHPSFSPSSPSPFFWFLLRNVGCHLPILGLRYIEGKIKIMRQREQKGGVEVSFCNNASKQSKAHKCGIHRASAPTAAAL